MKTSHSIAIIGGGPTGLMFGCLCALRGWDFVLLDKRVSHSTHSRSIGIHPPSLRLFEQIGLRPALLDQGTRIETGVAHIERERCGTIDFTRIAHGPPYILTLAQSITESLLEKRLRELAPDSLVRGQAVKEMVKNNNRYHLKTERGVTISVDWVVLTAGVMALGLLFVNIVKTGQDEIGSSLGGSLSSSATTIPEIDF